MADMLVNLLNLPPLDPVLAAMRRASIVVRRAAPYEITPVRRFVERHFTTAWADEISAKAFTTCWSTLSSAKAKVTSSPVRLPRAGDPASSGWAATLLPVVRSPASHGSGKPGGRPGGDSSR